MQNSPCITKRPLECTEARYFSYPVVLLYVSLNLHLAKFKPAKELHLITSFLPFLRNPLQEEWLGLLFSPPVKQ